MNWDSLSTQIATIVVALVGSGGAFAEWLRRRSHSKPPIPREEAEKAQAAQHLDESTQIVTAALTERINQLQREFNDRLDAAERSRRADKVEFERRYNRLRNWAIDIETRWDYHRKNDRPPGIPD